MVIHKTYERAERKKNFKQTIILIIVSLFIGLFWALTPFFGWSEYSLEGSMISCSVEWNKRTPSAMSYNVSMFIFVFIIPFTTILSTNIMLIRKVSFKIIC